MLYGSAAAAEDAPITYDRVTLSVNAEKQVDNDTVVAQLFSEREGEQTSQLASEINENIAWALERVKNVAAVSAQTTGYHSQPVYQKQKIIGLASQAVDKTREPGYDRSRRTHRRITEPAGDGLHLLHHFSRSAGPGRG